MTNTAASTATPSKSDSVKPHAKLSLHMRTLNMKKSQPEIISLEAPFLHTEPSGTPQLSPLHLPHGSLNLLALRGVHLTKVIGYTQQEIPAHDSAVNVFNKIGRSGSVK